MAAAARKTASEIVLETLAGAWRHAVSARFRGGLTAAVGGVLALSLASWRAADPSFDASSPGSPGNLLGAAGADIADIAMQSLGLTAWLAATLLLALGVARAAHPDPDATRASLRWRGLAGAAGVLLFAGALGAVAPPTIWPLASGLGGLIGDLEANGLAGLASAIGAPVAATIADLIIGGVGGWLMAVALGVRWAHVVGFLHVHSRGAAKPKASQRGAPVRASAPPKSRARPDITPAPTAIVADDAPLAISTPKPAAKPSGREARENQPTLFADDAGFRLPELAMLAKSKPRAAAFDEGALRQNARVLEGVLAEFGVRGQIDQIRPGPVVTLYELVPAPGVKSARVVALCDDIARSMSVAACRVAVVPGRNAIGIELPNAKRETVYLRDLLASAEYEKNGPVLPMALGETIGGEPYIADLSRMPHLLIAGTTGSGKSVGVNAMILSILYRLPPSQCRFIMVDPKMLELSAYDGIPHLLAPVVTDPKKAIVALKWTVREMEDRYRRMSKISVRNIAGYNERAREAIAKGEHFVRTVQTGFDEQGRPVYEEERLTPEPMPYLVVVIDEVADLMMVAGKDIEGAVQRLAQMARAAGIHLIMATQRPSVDVITGTIKANFPTRISFQVTSRIDARTILGEQGAEQLLGQGDMLYMAGGGRVTRLHGPFVSDGEVEAVTKFLREQGQPSYIEEVTAAPDEDEDGGGEFGGGDGGGGGNELYDQAVAVVTRDGKASTSYIQRRLQIGYNRAASLMERMEREGVVGPANHAGKREILAPPPPR
ncbi:MAG TPA: DNA translocase FtsK 4TM domain-containing protein [Caulobacteraceae bacterium]|jgi:S-DNA-T family DNA segregation ATPase FtsK/SpoIIIE|nr:DNA translocase FtsK 4TM domain-containing protein [Caulobacteraceae bacterium]